MGEKFFKIGEAAELLGVHIQTLRIYDREGIISPSRTDTNRRGYSEEDIARAKVLLFLTRKLSVNLNGAKIILKILEKSRMTPELSVEYLQNIVKQTGIEEN